MTFVLNPDGTVICLDADAKTMDALGQGTQERASHVYRDDSLRLPWRGKPVLAARSSEEGQWTVRLSMSPINGRLAGYQLPHRFASRREAIQAEVRFIEENVI